MGKTAIITGGTAGIGYGIAEAFAQQWIHLVLSYFHDEAKAEQAKAKLSTYWVQILVVHADSGNEDDITKLFLQAKDFFGMIDILVNNIWSALPDRPHTDEWEILFHHHLMSTVWATEQFNNQLGNGIWCIINISSVLWINPLAWYKWARLEAYCCMKSAVNMYTTIAANKFHWKIRVNSIAPWNTDTDGWKNADESFKDARKKWTLIQRFVQPAEIWSMAVQLVENQALNGQVFVVDGWVVGKGYE